MQKGSVYILSNQIMNMMKQQPDLTCEEAMVTLSMVVSYMLKDVSNAEHLKANTKAFFKQVETILE